MRKQNRIINHNMLIKYMINLELMPIGNYKTTEQVAGIAWGNQTLYRKIVQLGTSTGSSSTWIDDNVSIGTGIDMAWLEWGYVYVTEGTGEIRRYPIPYTTNAEDNRIKASVGVKNNSATLGVATYGTRFGKSNCTFSILYTKS